MGFMWIIVACLAACVGILAVIHLVVPVLLVLGAIVSRVVFGIGWIINQVFDYVGGTIGDVVRFIGAIPAMILLFPMTLMSVVFGRWSAAAHYAASVKREAQVAGACLYRIGLQRPLKLVGLHGVLEGVEQRVPEAMQGVPGADKPKRKVGQFDGYTIVGSLRSGGSGAKLYVAEPNDEKRKQLALPERVVIKCFALTDGSSLPQIIRESRALEAARKLGLVLDHDMDPHRFFYVMPYHPGDHLGIITRQMHGAAGGDGLNGRQFAVLLQHTRDLLSTLSTYHQAGLWHKDVKPENVIVHDGQAHLVDLGLVTPLRSAMTLTTHGTEYFRDPEMVRQALRGVKVHQVDGAKFDIYAAGAVMYFVIENTFPAHGGLSRFHEKSPESVRWIIRRAMAEYNKRYESADEMLADLDCVLTAANPYDVKPVALPSMSGREHAVADVESTDVEPEVVATAHAGSPIPPSPSARPEPDSAGAQAKTPADDTARSEFKIGIGKWALRLEKSEDGLQMTAGTIGSDGQPTGRRRKGRRPRLRVANWWTGAYNVEDPGVEDEVVQAAAVAAQAVAGAERAARKAVDEAFDGPVHDELAGAFREHTRSLRRQVRDAARQVRHGAKSARKAASEQRRSARARAADIRSRVMKRRTERHDRALKKAVAASATPREGQRALGVILVVAGVLLVVFLARSPSHNNVTIDMGSSTSSSNPILAAMPKSRSGSKGRWLIINESGESESTLEDWAGQIPDPGRIYFGNELTDAEVRMRSRLKGYEQGTEGASDLLVSAILQSEYDGIIFIHRDRQDDQLTVQWIDDRSVRGKPASRD